MDFRLSSAHKALVEKAAVYSGDSLTGFAVATLVEEARRVIREHESVELTARDRDRFLSLLDNPACPSDDLVRARSRYDEIITRSD